MTEKQEMIFLIPSRSIWKQIFNYLSFLAVAGALIGPGVLVHSSAMQWLGFLMIVCFVLAWVRKENWNNGKTPQQAADWLLKKYGVRAQSTEEPRP